MPLHLPHLKHPKPLKLSKAHLFKRATHLRHLGLPLAQSVQQAVQEAGYPGSVAANSIASADLSPLPSPEASPAIQPPSNANS